MRKSTGSGGSSLTIFDINSCVDDVIVLISCSTTTRHYLKQRRDLMLGQISLYSVFSHFPRHVILFTHGCRGQSSLEGGSRMYASRRVLQLARACRASFYGAGRRSVNVGAARLAASWLPARTGLVRAARINSFPVTPALFCRRGYAGTYATRITQDCMHSNLNLCRLASTQGCGAPSSLPNHGNRYAS